MHEESVGVDSCVCMCVSLGVCAEERKVVCADVFSARAWSACGRLWVLWQPCWGCVCLLPCSSMEDSQQQAANQWQEPLQLAVLQSPAMLQRWVLAPNLCVFAQQCARVWPCVCVCVCVHGVSACVRAGDCASNSTVAVVATQHAPASGFTKPLADRLPWAAVQVDTATGHCVCVSADCCSLDVLSLEHSGLQGLWFGGCPLPQVSSEGVC